MLIQQFPKQLQQQLQQLPYFSSTFNSNVPNSLLSDLDVPLQQNAPPQSTIPRQKKTDRKKKKKLSKHRSSLNDKSHHQQSSTDDSNSNDDIIMSKPSPTKKRPIDHLLGGNVPSQMMIPPSLSDPSPSAAIRSFNIVHTDSKFTTKQNIFQLWEQPEENQRKAYKNENRYILPNPLTISLIKPGQPQTDGQPSPYDNGYNLPPLKDCVVSVRLVHGNGEELEDGKQNILEGQTEKSLSGSENDFEKKAEFSLKVLETSGRSKFRLLFTITFTMDGYRCEETILSNPFKVISNKKKNASANTTKPKLSDLIPKQGPCGEGQEVWIRGNFFTDRATMIVRFGDKEARITETEENLITCIAPPMTSLTSPNKETVVQVTVTNIHPTKGQLVSARPLYYRYIPSIDTVLSNSDKSFIRETDTFENLPGPFDHLKSISTNSVGILNDHHSSMLSNPSNNTHNNNTSTNNNNNNHNNNNNGTSTLESILDTINVSSTTSSNTNPSSSIASTMNHQYPKASRGKMSISQESDPNFINIPFNFGEGSLGGLGLSNPSLFPLNLPPAKPEEMGELVSASDSFYRANNF